AFLGIGQELRPELGSMIVVRALEGDLTTALLVDRDLGMTTVSAEQLQNLEEMREDRLAPYMYGVCADGDDLLGVLNLESILQSLAVVN
ncbi:MAG TPA: chemotaxis protein CheW, partial [Blastocatellia bacterium]|nr:chemotaxis protein CheW [Blastocatellia bacterium]